MRKYYSLLIAAVFMASCGQSTTKEKETVAEENGKPNILLIIGDDIAFGDLGVYGSEIETPNFERLADAGVRFSNFHASPVC